MSEISRWPRWRPRRWETTENTGLQVMLTSRRVEPFEHDRDQLHILGSYH